MATRVFAAVDLGASGGRVMAGLVDDGEVDLRLVHRFDNAAGQDHGRLRWNLTGLYQEVLHGLAMLVEQWPEVESIGIDTWAVDYGLLDRSGQLIAEPIAYRDGRTASVIDEVHSRVSPEELYRINGLQFLPFTTLYQLAAEARTGRLGEAASVALLPDLLAYWLTGELRTELTNATTTGLVEVFARTWSDELVDRLELDPSLLPPLEPPGAIRGRLLSSVAERLGVDHEVVVTTVGSHDTASAVAGVPATNPNFAYAASGTWSLVGVECRTPIVTEASRRANFTNEGGVDGRIRFLRNVGGLWLLQESMRDWAERGHPQRLPDLLDQAAALAPGPVFDVDDPALIAPGGMPRRIRAAVDAAGHRPPNTPAELIRCVIDSLADGYGVTIETAARLSGRTIEVVHIVGGGARNQLLCQATADRTGRPVVAGPVEATALGNITTQARAHGALPDDLDAVRASLRGQPDVRKAVEPRATRVTVAR
jgi:rhamnulokinase